MLDLGVPSTPHCSLRHARVAICETSGKQPPQRRRSDLATHNGSSRPAGTGSSETFCAQRSLSHGPPSQKGAWFRMRAYLPGAGAAIMDALNALAYQDPGARPVTLASASAYQTALDAQARDLLSAVLQELDAELPLPARTERLPPLPIRHRPRIPFEGPAHDFTPGEAA